MDSTFNVLLLSLELPFIYIYLFFSFIFPPLFHLLKKRIRDQNIQRYVPVAIFFIENIFHCKRTFPYNFFF